MTHLAALLFAYAGFAALCVSMANQPPDTLGRRLAPREQRHARLAGGLGLVAAYAAAVAAGGWKFGSVEWAGGVMLAALTLTLLLPYQPRLAARAGVGAAVFGALLMVGAALVRMS